eukprot:3939199-Rhodomonas_salina.2
MVSAVPSLEVEPFVELDLFDFEDRRRHAARLRVRLGRDSILQGLLMSSELLLHLSSHLAGSCWQPTTTVTVLCCSATVGENASATVAASSLLDSWEIVELGQVWAGVQCGRGGPATLRMPPCVWHGAGAGSREHALCSPDVRHGPAEQALVSASAVREPQRARAHSRSSPESTPCRGVRNFQPATPPPGCL